MKSHRLFNLTGILVVWFCFSATPLVAQNVLSPYNEIYRSSKNLTINTNNWAVRINPNADVTEIARSMNAVNLGQIAYLDNTYLFQFSEQSLKSEIEQTRKQLHLSDQVMWFQQQLKRWRYKRIQTKDTFFSDPLIAFQWHINNNGQTGGVLNEDIHVRPVWLQQGITGQNVVVAVLDDGIQHTHPDISDNYNAELSWDFNDKDSDPFPTIGGLSDDTHGTAIAGIIAARDNNSCGVGVAYRAQIAGLRIIADSISDADEANAFSYMRNKIHIYNISWGPQDNGKQLESPGVLTLNAIEKNIKQGRNGLGNIYVCSAGNGLESNDNVNYDGYANSRYTIAVSALNHLGKQTNYSEPGAAILIAAPGGNQTVGIATIDLVGRHGVAKGDCRENFSGTSASTGIVSGVIALMLEANPKLTWRDVQHILVNTARKNDPNDDDWKMNGAGFHINHKYGFGAVDATAAVQMAASSSWKSLTNSSAMPYKKAVQLSIPDNNSEGLTSIITVPEEHAFKIEHVDVIFRASHRRRGDLRLVLTSPSGTQSVLADCHEDENTDYNNWRFMTVRNWNELSPGDWRLTVADLKQENTGKLISWELILYINDDAGPLPPLARDDEVITTINTPVQINVLTNDFDPNGDPLSVVDVSLPEHGTVSILDEGVIRYTPNNLYTGDDQFTYTISDGKGGRDTATIFIKTVVVKDGGFEAGIPNPYWTETSLLNDSSIIENEELSHAGKYLVKIEGGMMGLESSVLKQDVKIPATANADLTFWFRIVESDVFARFNIRMDNQVIYTVSEADALLYPSWRPVIININAYADGKNHSLQIDAIIQQGNGVTSFFVDDISLTVGGQLPIAQNDSASTTYLNPITIDVLFNDFDPNKDPLTVIHISQPSNGNAIINFDNSITYTPNPHFVGKDIFHYTVSDISDGSDTGTVVVSVTSNDALKIDLPAEVIEGGEFTGYVELPYTLVTPIDIDLSTNDTLKITIIDRQISLPAGEKRASFLFKTEDDDKTNGVQTATIKAETAYLRYGIGSLNILDNDTNPIITITPSNLNVSSSETQIQFSVNNAGKGNMRWNAQSSANWLIITDGESGINEGIILVTIAANYGDYRTGQLIVSSPDAENKEVIAEIIQQAPNNPIPILSVSPVKTNIPSIAGSVTFNVINTNKGDMHWKAETSHSWLSIENGAGLNQGLFTVQYATNMSSERTGFVVVSSPEAMNVSVTVQIIQESGLMNLPNLSVAPANESVNFFEGQVSLSIKNIGKGTLNWQAITTNDWLNIIKGSSGTNDGEVVISYLENTGPQRKGIITVSAQNALNSPQSIEIIQSSGEIVELKHALAEENNWLGVSVDISQQWAISGANNDSEHGEGSGAVYILEKTSSTWQKNNKLTPIDATIYQNFGCSVSINGSYAVIGANSDIEKGDKAGAAYIFTYNGEVWIQHAKLLPDEENDYQYFGQSVAISDNYAIIGGFGIVVNDIKSGAALVYKNNNGNWEYQTKIVPFDAGNDDFFASALALSDDKLIIGSYRDNGELDDLSMSGSAYIYKNRDGSWEVEQKLYANDAKPFDFFGCSVDIHGDTAIIGAYGTDDLGNKSGAAYIFTFNGTQWIQTSRLTSPDGAKEDRFGHSVSISDNYLVVGAIGEDSLGNKAGSVYLYLKKDHSWIFYKKINASDGGTDANFGYALSLWQNQLLVGAYGDDEKGTYSGAIYFFIHGGFNQ